MAEIMTERTRTLTDKQRADLENRARGIFQMLTEREMRPAEAEALRLGTHKSELGDTNWVGLALAAELAKSGCAVLVTDAGETIIKKVKKG